MFVVAPVFTVLKADGFAPITTTSFSSVVLSVSSGLNSKVSPRKSVMSVKVFFGITNKGGFNLVWSAGTHTLN